MVKRGKESKVEIGGGDLKENRETKNRKREKSLKYKHEIKTCQEIEKYKTC